MAQGSTAGSAGAEAKRVRVAGLVRRLAASLCDLLLLVPLVLLFGGAASLSAGQALPRLTELGIAYLVHLAVDGGPAGAVALGIGALVVFLYAVIFLSLRGQTPGQKILGVRVIDAYGEPPSLGRSLLRALALALSVGLFGLGILWIGFSREKRGLHDLLAGTWVVRAPARALGAAEAAARGTLGVTSP